MISSKRESRKPSKNTETSSYLWSGTCDITVKEGKFIKLGHRNKKTIDLIVNRYRRAINIVDKFSGAEIKYNKTKGHKKPAKFRVEDFKVTNQIKELNKRTAEVNESLNKNIIRTSKYYFISRSVKRGGRRKSIKISINKRDGVHSRQLLTCSLAITKQILIDTYSECYNIEQHCELVQLVVEEEEQLAILTATEK